MTCCKECGRPLATQADVEAFDALPWEEREVYDGNLPTCWVEIIGFCDGKED